MENQFEQFDILKLHPNIHISSKYSWDLLKLCDKTEAFKMKEKHFEHKFVLLGPDICNNLKITHLVWT